MSLRLFCQRWIVSPSLSIILLVCLCSDVNLCFRLSYKNIYQDKAVAHKTHLRDDRSIHHDYLSADWIAHGGYSIICYDGG